MPHATSGVWDELYQEAGNAFGEEPLLSGLLQTTVLDQSGLSGALAVRLSQCMGGGDLSRLAVHDVCADAFSAIPGFEGTLSRDLSAIRDRDPTCRRYLNPFLV